MTTPVVVQIRAEGAEATKAVLASVRDSYLDLERAIAASSARAGRAFARGLEEGAAKAREALKKAGAEDDFARGIGLPGAHPGRTPSASGTTAGDFLGMKNLDAQLSGAAASFAKIGAIGVGLAAFKSGIDIATESLKAFGGFVINEVMAPALKLDATAQQVANASGGKLTADYVSNASRAASLANNMDQNELIQGAGAFQDLTGQSKMSFELLPDVAAVAKGRGASVKELMTLLGQIHQEGMTTDDLRKAFYGMIAQGDSGSVTIAQQAAVGGRVGAAAGKFGGDRADANAKAWALIQGSSKALGGPAEAATALTKFTEEAILVAKKTAGLKSNITTDRSGVSTINDPMQLLADIYKMTSGDNGKLRKLGFQSESARLVGAFQANYQQDFDAAKKSGRSDKEAQAEGALGVRDALEAMARQSTTSTEEARKRDAVMATTGEQWESAMNSIKAEILKAKPAFEALAKNLVEKAPQIGDAARTLTEALISIADWIERNFGGGDEKRTERRRRDYEAENAKLERDIDAGKASGEDVSALEQRKAAKDLAQKRTEETLSALQVIPIDQASPYAANLRAGGGTGVTASGEVTDAAVTKNYERIIQLIKSDPTAEISSYAGGNLGADQSKILEDFRQSVLGELKGNVDKGAKGVDTDPLAAAVKRAAAEIDKLGDAASAANRSNPMGVGGK